MQPYDSITKIGQWCLANEVDFALAGSWSLLFSGVNLPTAPHDLDIALGLTDLTQFFADNTWLRQRAGESVGRAIVMDDCYTIDLLPTLVEFQQATLARAVPMNFGGMMVKLTDPTDVLLYKLGHEYFDEKGQATCKAIIDWRYARKPNKPQDHLNLAGGDTGKAWAGPTHIYAREVK